ncbi:hypothetical protein [uncultured Tateyamaria sp.]|nr:hypothetical protein [uncultured Tateyamaria sp.]
MTRFGNGTVDWPSDPTLRVQAAGSTAATRFLGAGLGPSHIANHHG